MKALLVYMFEAAVCSGILQAVYAWLLDEIPAVLISIALVIVIFRYAPSFSWFFAFFLAFLSGYIVYFLYVFIPTAVSLGGSLGMKMLRIKAVRRGMPFINRHGSGRYCCSQRHNRQKKGE